MIMYLFANKEITDAGSHAKTQIQQLFTRFELPKPLERSNEGKEIQIKMSSKMMSFLRQNKIQANELLTHTNDTKEAYKEAIFVLQKLGLVLISESKQSNKIKNIQMFDVILNDKHINFLNRYGIVLSNTIIGHGEAPTKKDAEFKAYSNALDFLSKIRTELAPEGITTSWAEKNKLLLDISNPTVSQYVQPVAEKLAREQFVSFEFVTPGDETADAYNHMEHLSVATEIVTKEEEEVVEE